MQKKEKDRTLNLDDSSRYGSSALSASMLTNNKRETEINNIMKRNEERKLQRINSGIDLKRDMLAQ